MRTRRQDPDDRSAGSVGVGRRHGRESIEQMTEAQTVVGQRLVRHGASLDELFALPGGKGQEVLTSGLRTLKALRLP